MRSLGATTDIDLAAIGLQAPFDPSNIFRRRGPLKLLNKVKSEPKELIILYAGCLIRPAPEVRRIVTTVVASVVMIIYIFVYYYNRGYVC